MKSLASFFDRTTRPCHGQTWNGLLGEEDKQEGDTSSLSSGDGEHAQATHFTHRNHPKSRFWVMLLLFACLILLAISSAAFMAYKNAINKQITKPIVDQCGSTPVEARSRGCIFETTLSLWVPPACYDFELETMYLQQPGLKYYRDVNLTDEVSVYEVKSGESIGWFVPWDHHVRHCAFAFRKFHRAVKYGQKVDGYVLQYEHTEHCIKMMTEPEEWRSNRTQFDMRMFPYCGKEGGYNVNSKYRGEWT